MIKDLFDLIKEVTGVQDPAVVLLLTGLLACQIMNYRSQSKLGDIVKGWDTAFAVHQTETQLKIEGLETDIEHHRQRLNKHGERLDNHATLLSLLEKERH